MSVSMLEAVTHSHWTDVDSTITFIRCTLGYWNHFSPNLTTLEKLQCEIAVLVVLYCSGLTIRHVVEAILKRGIDRTTRTPLSKEALVAMLGYDVDNSNNTDQITFNLEDELIAIQALHSISMTMLDLAEFFEPIIWS